MPDWLDQLDPAVVEIDEGATLDALTRAPDAPRIAIVIPADQRDGAPASLETFLAVPPDEESLMRNDYGAYFATLPAALRAAVEARWGPAERDPVFRESRLDCGRFVISVRRLDNVAVALEPEGGDAAVPSHGCLALYAWLADGFRAQTILRLGRAAGG